MVDVPYAWVPSPALFASHTTWSVPSAPRNLPTVSEGLSTSASFVHTPGPPARAAPDRASADSATRTTTPTARNLGRDIRYLLDHDLILRNGRGTVYPGQRKLNHEAGFVPPAGGATTTSVATVGWAPMTEIHTDLDVLLEGLNNPQREAVMHPGGPLLILAGAGSGKTRVLTHRIAYLLATEAARPNEILAITFTNKAAGEMRDRVGLLVGGRIRAMWVMTFHAACARMLRAHADKLGYTRQFTIYDQADSRRLIKRCLDELGIDSKRFTPAAIGSQISAAKNLLEEADAYAQKVGSYFEQTVADAYREYERQLHRMNAMDFDDLLVRAVNVLELFDEVRDRYATSFQHVLVDEYQDTNHAQYRLLQLLAKEHRNLAVVGDPDQSIYQFRGADIRNILEFEDDFVDAHIVRLEQNYRSTQNILDAANAVIANNRGRKSKSLWSDVGQGDPIKIRELDDEHAEARFVTGEILRLLDEGVARSEIAVFYRTNAQSRVLEDTLTRAEIAYQVVGGTKFYERAEIKDAIAYLVTLVNPQDTGAFTRIVNVAAEHDAAGPEEGGGGLDVFLQQIALRSDADERSDEEGLITLMTLHNAKGLEFGIVFMIGCEEGVFPHSRALDEGGLEEERRLCYVGITRAERDLYLCYARTRSVFGARAYGLRSRFVDEVPAELTDEEAQVAVAPAAGGRLAATTTWAGARSDAPAPEFRLGDDVTHAAFGEGVVTGLEPGGIVVVRFSSVGTERKLMAAYAPITRR